MQEVERVLLDSIEELHGHMRQRQRELGHQSKESQQRILECAGSSQLVFTARKEERWQTRVCLAKISSKRGSRVGSERTFGVLGEHHIMMMLQSRFGRTDLRVISVSLDMFFQILGALEGLATEITFMRLERHMHTNVRSDVVALDGGSITRPPLAGEVQVIGTLTTDMALANVFLLDGEANVSQNVFFSLLYHQSQCEVGLVSLFLT